MNDDPLIHHEEPLFELQIDEASGSYFREAARWTNFISIIYFIAIALMVLCLFFLGAIASGLGPRMFGSANPGTALTAVLGIIFGFMIVFFGVFAFLLYRFGTLVRRGIERQDQLTFNAGLRALKNFFVIYGVISVMSVIFSLTRLL